MKSRIGEIPCPSYLEDDMSNVFSSSWLPRFCKYSYNLSRLDMPLKHTNSWLMRMKGPFFSPRSLALLAKTIRNFVLTVRTELSRPVMHDGSLPGGLEELSYHLLPLGPAGLDCKRAQASHLQLLTDIRFRLLDDQIARSDSSRLLADLFTPHHA
ncbi:hypothetical protein K474DRAFT_651303 [Panus rudis PR-1116 ss-1]|nr:hypothetical protein K474DRAFT_651303 [Panus rudis PR-1116 ss-1]